MVQQKRATAAVMEESAQSEGSSLAEAAARLGELRCNKVGGICGGGCQSLKVAVWDGGSGRCCGCEGLAQGWGRFKQFEAGDFASSCHFQISSPLK